MLVRKAVASAAALAAIAGGAVAVTALPADAAVTRGTSGCFSYSYDNYSGKTSVTVYLHNRCKTKHYVKVYVSQHHDKCYGLAANKKDHHKYKGTVHPTIQHVKQVTDC